jgi:hypothetical protein
VTFCSTSVLLVTCSGSFLYWSTNKDVCLFFLGIIVTSLRTVFSSSINPSTNFVQLAWSSSCRGSLLHSVSCMESLPQYTKGNARFHKHAIQFSVVYPGSGPRSLSLLCNGLMTYLNLSSTSSMAILFIIFLQCNSNSSSTVCCDVACDCMPPSPWASCEWFWHPLVPSLVVYEVLITSSECDVMCSFASVCCFICFFISQCGLSGADNMSAQGWASLCSCALLVHWGYVVAIPGVCIQVTRVLVTVVLPQSSRE